MTDQPPTAGVILAGGLARRMGGGDKPMRMVGGRTILDHVIERLSPQCEPVLLNANGDPSRFSSFHLPIVPDSVPGHPGPLAGVLAALNWTADHRPDVEWVVSVSGDCPFLPRDLVRRFHEAVSKESSQLAVAASAGQVHPVIGLWRVDLHHDLQRAVLVEEVRKIDRWTSRYRTATVAWPAEPVDPFFNTNTLEELAEAERLAKLAVH
jgi:molybdopterin-guanine dinucleotide biosynthesis protein A